MAPKLSFSAIVRKALADNNGTLLPEVYTKAGYTENLCGVHAHDFVDRIDAVIAGKEAEGEVPDFLRVAHRGRKNYGVEFNQILQPPHPDVRKRPTTDVTKEAPTNWWPAIVTMSPEMVAVREKSLAAEERARLATGEMKEWFQASVHSRSSSTSYLSSLVQFS